MTTLQVCGVGNRRLSFIDAIALSHMRLWSMTAQIACLHGTGVSAPGRTRNLFKWELCGWGDRSCMSAPLGRPSTSVVVSFSCYSSSRVRTRARPGDRSEPPDPLHLGSGLHRLRGACCEATTQWGYVCRSNLQFSIEFSSLLHFLLIFPSVDSLTHLSVVFSA